VSAMADETSSISVSLLGPGGMSFWLLVFTIWRLRRQKRGKWEKWTLAVWPNLGM
jgi:hypothetical protein